MNGFLVEQRPIGDACVLLLHGRLDAAVALDFKDQLRRIIGGGDVSLIVDLSHLSFVDSTGLSVLVSGLKSASAAGGDLVLTSLPPIVRSIIELTRLHRVFRIYDDEASAKNGLEGALQR